VDNDVVNLTIDIPQITPEGKRLAQDVANVRLIMTVGGKPVEYQPAEVTDDLIQAEARRVADIPDPSERAAQLASLYRAFVHHALAAQLIAREVATVADELHALNAKLEPLKSLRVTRKKDLREGS